MLIRKERTFLPLFAAARAVYITEVDLQGLEPGTDRL